MAVNENVLGIRVLSDVSQGDKVRLHSILAGRELGLRLSEMGLVVGSEFRLLSKSSHGRVVLLLGETRLALGAGVAAKLMVAESEYISSDKAASEKMF